MLQALDQPYYTRDDKFKHLYHKSGHFKVQINQIYSDPTDQNQPIKYTNINLLNYIISITQKLANTIYLGAKEGFMKW